MSALSRAKSPEVKSDVKLITLYNVDLPAQQSHQSFRVQSNTTVFDLINHLKKIYQNKEIQLFIQQNQLFKGNLNTYLFPILQQCNIRTIQFKVIEQNSLIQTQTQKRPYTSDTNQMKSQYNYANQNASQQQSQIEQQNQSQLSNQTNQNEKVIPEISLPSYSQANPQQILQLKEENVYLQQQLTSEKQQNLELQKQIALFKQQVDEYLKQQQQKIVSEQEQKLKQSQREYSEQINQLKAQLEREKMEKEQLMKQIAELKKNNQFQARISALDRTSALAKEPSPLVESPLKSSFFEKGGISSQHSIDPRLSSTAYNDQSRILFQLNCSHRIQKNELEQQLTSAMYRQTTATCRECNKPIGLGVCRQLGQAGQTYLDYKCKQDLLQIQKKIYEKNNYYLQCNSRGCGFFCINTPNLQGGIGFCPQCLQNTIPLRFGQETATPITRSSINPRSAQTNDYMQNIQSTYGIDNQSGVVVSYSSKNNNIKIQDVTPAPIQYTQTYNPNFRYIRK